MTSKNRIVLVVVVVALGAIVVFHKQALVAVVNVMNIVYPVIYRDRYAVGGIKDALSRSNRLCEEIARERGKGRTEVETDRTIRNFLWDDRGVVSVKVYGLDGAVLGDAAFAKEEGVLQVSPSSLDGDLPLLVPREHNRLDVHRFIYDGSNTVAMLSMRRRTRVQVSSNDIVHFRQYGDGGRR